jgi:hypothetical protein
MARVSYTLDRTHTTIFTCAACSFYWSVDGSLPVLAHLLYQPYLLQVCGLVLDRGERDRGVIWVRVDVVEDLPDRRPLKVYSSEQKR